MIKLLLACGLVASFLPTVFSQPDEISSTNIPRLVKTAIGDSGASAYLPEEMPEFTVEKSEDSSEVYVSEVGVDDFMFGCITVKFFQPLTDASTDELEELLIGYMEYLGTSFEVYDSEGFGTGHTLEDFPDAIGVIDNWENIDDLQIAVKGWIDPHYICFLYIAGEEEYPHFNLQQMYFDGFRFDK